MWQGGGQGSGGARRAPSAVLGLPRGTCKPERGATSLLQQTPAAHDGLCHNTLDFGRHLDGCCCGVRPSGCGELRRLLHAMGAGGRGTVVMGRLGRTLSNGQVGQMSLSTLAGPVHARQTTATAATRFCPK